MIYLSLALALIVFMGVVRLGDLVERSVEVVRTARHAVAIITSPGLSDEQKEASVQDAARRLLKTLVAMVFWSATAVAAPVLLVVTGGALGLYSLDRAVDIAGSWAFIAIAALVMTAIWAIMARWTAQPR